MTKSKSLLEKAKEIVIAHNGYVIRKFGTTLIAVPKDALCFAHDVTRGETNGRAVYALKQIIDSNSKGGGND